MTENSGLILPTSVKTWHYRAIQYCCGNQSLMGSIVIAVIHKTPHNPPAFGHNAWIDKTGMLRCDFVTKDWQKIPDCRVGPVIKIVEEWRRVADGIKATDKEREDMVQQFKYWAARDELAKSTLEG